MSENIILHSDTAIKIKSFIERPGHCLLICAPVGSGKTTIAKYIAAQLLSSPAETLHKNVSLISIKPIDGIISIDQVRLLQQRIKTVPPGSSTVRQVVLIEQAEHLTLEAQNALLKLLEEPPTYLVIILTASSTTALLPTVVSRSQVWQLRPPTQDQIQKYFTAQNFSIAAINKTYLISGGRIGLMTELLHQQQDHPLIQAIDLVKQLLSATYFERLTKIDYLTKDKQALPHLLYALSVVCSAGLSACAEKNDRQKVKQWSERCYAAYYAEESFHSNANSKLLLSNLMLMI